VCVVADDQPGLLSHLGTALTTQSLDLLAAQVYGRVAPRGAEVVDLLWLRRDEALGSAVVDADMARLAGLLGGLATGELRADGRALDPRRAPAASATLVHFDDEKGSKGSTSLILETVERPGLFRAVLDALVRAGVHLTGSRRASGGADRVVHRFVIAEGNGAAPDQYRRGVLQAEVLRVVELVAHREPRPAAKKPTPARSDGILIDEAHPLFAQ
jgi:UTP:GlnB (protein PII) uridylyltransferase